MAKHRRGLPWADIIIDDSAKTILVRQDWSYTWKLSKGDAVWKPSEWTDEEKAAFHDECEKSILAVWSSKRKYVCTGEVSFAKTNADIIFDLVFDIRLATGPAHWKVDVLKIKPTGYHRSRVSWASRRISLDTNDMKFKTIVPKDSTIAYFQKGAPHEFGHAIGNMPNFKRGDEYPSSSSHYFDKASIMNVGMEIRDRHFQTIEEKLDKVIRGVKFKPYTKS